MSNLYVVVDEGPDEVPRDQVVNFFTDLDAADAAGPGTVYQLVEPREQMSNWPGINAQHCRREGAELAVQLHADGGWDSADVINTADAIAQYIEHGTKPAGEDEDAESTPPDIVVRRTNSGPRTVEILVDGEVVARTDYDEGGWPGMDAVDRAATAIAAALACPVRREEPEA